MLLKGEFGGGALNSHGNYIVDHGKSWKNHGIVFLNFCGNPEDDFLSHKCWLSSMAITLSRRFFANRNKKFTWSKLLSRGQ